MQKRVLIISTTTGYQTRMFAEAATRMGLEPVLAIDQCHKLDDPWGAGVITVRFHHAERWAGEIAAHAPFDGLVAVGDRTTFLAALAAERLGLPYNSPAAVEACRNKYLMRERFRAAGMLVPAYFRVPLETDAREAAARAAFPCVLKPIGLSASRGVIRANDGKEFIAAFERIRALLTTIEIAAQRDPQNRYIQIEEFIPGREFALEGLVTDGRLQTLALFDKPDPLDGPFFEETIYITPSREPAEVQRELIRTVERAVEALGLTRGPLHAEMRYNSRGAWMLEAAARPIGGLCARSLRFDRAAGETACPTKTGLQLEELILRHALGEDVSAARLAPGASGVMMIPIPREGIYEDVSGVECAAAVAGIEDVMITAKQGQKLVPLPEGASYLGFIFARAETPERVEQALRAAHAALAFKITPTLPVFSARVG